MTPSYDFNWNIIWNNWQFIAAGLPLTMLISIGGTIVGLVLGIPIAIGRVRNIRLLSIVLSAYVEVFRNTPLLVQIVWFYYVLPILIHAQLDPLQAGIFAIGLNASAYLS